MPNKAKARLYVPDTVPEDEVAFDISKAQRVVFPNLKPTTESISLRLPVWMLHELKALANQRDVPYQSLLKTFLADRLSAERKAA
jgi:predicted DNA binding CopG/RHH family protein